MKVGIVSNLYPPEARGGAELVASRVADALYERGHEVFVLTTQPFDGVRSLFPRIRERTLESVYRFFPLNLYGLRQDRSVPFPLRALWHLVDLFSPFGRRAIRHVILDEDPDVVITHNLKGIGISIGREIQRQGVRHIHTLHDVQLSIPSGLLMAGEEQSWLNRSFLRRWYESGVKREMGTPDVVLSPSQFLADFYRERGMFVDTRMEILPNPLPSGHRPALPDKRPRMKTRFLYVGQLEPHKGIRLLFEALQAFGEEVELYVAGEGSLTQEVIEMSERDARVTYHGFVPLEHLVQLLENIDAVVIPSLCYENSPTVIYEAYLIGAPVVAARIGGIPELVKGGETGQLFMAGSVKDLVRALRDIHDRRDFWWEQTMAIREHAKQYALDRYVDRLEGLMVS